MQSLTIRPTAVTGIAALVAAATITGSGVQPAEISPPRLLAESVQLQVLSTPAAAATAAAIADPGRILTAAVSFGVAIVASAAWFIAFPITLPASLIIASAFANVPFAGPLQSAPFLFVGIPAYFVGGTFNELQFSLGLNPAAARKPKAGAVAATRKPSASTRAARKPTAARAPKSQERSSIHGRRP